MEKWAPGITAIEHADLGESPAAVNRETGVMYINPDFKLTSDQWYFIMLHEMGHLMEQTKDELTADAWAHKQYLKEKKRSLKESVFALTDLLTFQKDEDFIRARYQLERAKQADKLSMYNSSHKYYGNPNCDPDYSTYFIGGKKPNNSTFNKEKSEFFGQYTGLGASLGTAIPGVGNVAGAVGGFVADIGAAIFGGGGPDINQRVRDYNTYVSQGKVLGGNPQDDATWIFNFDYMRKNPSDPWRGVLNDSRFINNWNKYLASVGYYDDGKQAVPLKNKNNSGGNSDSQSNDKNLYWIIGGIIVAIVIIGTTILVIKKK